MWNMSLRRGEWRAGRRQIELSKRLRSAQPDHSGGKFELRAPQDRNGRFSTEIFERYHRSEKALVAALTEKYIRGVSTRKASSDQRGALGGTVLARAR